MEKSDFTMLFWCLFITGVMFTLGILLAKYLPYIEIPVCGRYWCDIITPFHLVMLTLIFSGFFAMIFAVCK